MSPTIERLGSHPYVRKLGPSTCAISTLRSSSRKEEEQADLSDLHKASSLQPWFKNWQDKRQNKLTASTFAGAIGLWRNRRVTLWLEKLGAKEPFRGNLATWWSNIKEKEAIQKYIEITNNEVHFPTFQVYNDENRNKNNPDWIAASPDGLVESHSVYGLPCRGVLEIKCPYFDDNRLARPWRRVPLYYVPQAQGLMEIMDKDWMDFYVWTSRGSNLFRMYRDREYWEIMRLALSDFWLKHVLPARELCDEHRLKNPCFELGWLRPADKHQFCEHIVNESRRIVDDSPLMFREIRRW
ncbi:hypothetical protein LINPERHAP2_LOCUS23585 [Linum perenne]